jgi:hypothetical protein
VPVRLEAEDNPPAIPREKLMQRMVHLLAVRADVGAPHLFAQQADKWRKHVDFGLLNVRFEIVDAHERRQ